MVDLSHNSFQVYRNFLSARLKLFCIVQYSRFQNNAFKFHILCFNQLNETFHVLRRTKKVMVF